VINFTTMMNRNAVGLSSISLVLVGVFSFGGSGCSATSRVSGEYHDVNNPNNTVILKSDGTCEVDKVACIYKADGDDVTITMEMRGIIINGKVDGKQLTTTEQERLVGTVKLVWIRL
jgi:hypothetical protein